MSITSQFQSTLPVWGGTAFFDRLVYCLSEFQSTLPVWGGTLVSSNLRMSFRYFNPPSPCGEGPLSPAAIRAATGLFQSTLPVWGGTVPFGDALAMDVNFNPPSPCGEGLPGTPGHQDCFQISIHPPRVGRDFSALGSRFQADNISIHPPRVGRDGVWPDLVAHGVVFQSTLPVWGGTTTQIILDS